MIFAVTYRYVLRFAEINVFLFIFFIFFYTTSKPTQPTKNKKETFCSSSRESVPITAKCICKYQEKEAMYCLYCVKCSIRNEPIFFNVFGAQESIPINRFSQPMKLGGPVRQTGLSYWPVRLGIDSWNPQKVLKYGLWFTWIRPE
jgi:hypothetical protein